MTKGTLEWSVKNVNFSTGCSNNCVYCYAKCYAKRYGWKDPDEWHIMTNRDHMQNMKFKKYDGWVMSPSSHDITFRNYHLAVKVFTNILEAGNKLLIVTKPNSFTITGLVNDLYKWKDQILFRFTITTLDDMVRQYWETKAPPINERFFCLKYAREKGFQTSVSIEPFLDDTVVDLVKGIHPDVTETIWIGTMNFEYVPKEYIDKLAQDRYYTKENLLLIKGRIDALGFDNINYKDSFLNILKPLKQRIREEMTT